MLPSWFAGLAFILRKIEDLGQWPQSFLGEYMAMIPKVERDAYRPGQRPLSVVNTLADLT